MALTLLLLFIQIPILYSQQVTWGATTKITLQTQVDFWNQRITLVPPSGANITIMPCAGTPQFWTYLNTPPKHDVDAPGEYGANMTDASRSLYTFYWLPSSQSYDFYMELGGQTSSASNFPVIAVVGLFETYSQFEDLLPFPNLEDLTQAKMDSRNNKIYVKKPEDSAVSYAVYKTTKDIMNTPHLFYATACGVQQFATLIDPSAYQLSDSGNSKVISMPLQQNVWYIVSVRKQVQNGQEQVFNALKFVSSANQMTANGFIVTLLFLLAFGL